MPAEHQFSIPMRWVLALFALLLAVTATLRVAALVKIWGGPLLSGTLFLLIPTAKASAIPDLPASYVPLHKGSVDLSTGLYTWDDEDLILSKNPAFAWRRTYLVGDHFSRQFGIGTSDSGDWYLIGDGAGFQWAALVLNDSQIRFERLTPGRSYLNAVFGHAATPTRFYGAILGWAGRSWVLRLRDGTLMWFRGCPPGGSRICSLEEIRNPDGRRISFLRDPDGLLQRIDTGRQHIDLEYDNGRIRRAIDDAGHAVVYAYDKSGHLIQATTSEGIRRSYEYDAADRLVRIEQPERVIENTYDSGGRVVHQTIREPHTQDYHQRFAYKLKGDSVVETTIAENDGGRTLYRFDDHHYTAFEFYERPGKPPISVTFDRTSGSFARSITVRCTKDRRPVSVTVHRFRDEESMAAFLMQDRCD